MNKNSPCAKITILLSFILTLYVHAHTDGTETITEENYNEKVRQALRDANVSETTTFGDNSKVVLIFLLHQCRLLLIMLWMPIVLTVWTS